MKKFLLFMSLILSLNVPIYADVNLTITIPTAYVNRIIEMMNVKYPKEGGETTTQQAKRMIKELVKDALYKYERERDVKNAAISVSVPEDLIQ